MLYFSGYTPAAGNWTGDFNLALSTELKKHNIPYRELGSFDWQGPAWPRRAYLRLQSVSEDVWFLGWAQSPLIELIHHKPGRKFGLVVGVAGCGFDPLALTLETAQEEEKRRLALYDGLIANSHWCGACIAKAYPELAAKVTVCGFPFNFQHLNRYHRSAKEAGLVVFNQRFSPERLPVLEVELARRLTIQGYRVEHYSGDTEQDLASKDPARALLLSQARQAGLKWRHHPTREHYFNYLAQADLVITTSIADMLPSSLVEAITLGAVPIAPNAFCFPEFVHPDNLYTPYDLAEIVALVETRPHRRHSIDQYAQEKVVQRYLAAMGYHKTQV